MSRSRLDLPPGVDPVITEAPRGARVKITVEEPGFSDARIMIKFPFDGRQQEPLEIRAGESITLQVQGWIRNAIIVEALPRDGDNEDPDLEGGQHASRW